MATTTLHLKNGTSLQFKDDSFSVNYVENEDVSVASNTRRFNNESDRLTNLFTPFTVEVPASDGESTVVEDRAGFVASFYAGTTTESKYVVVPGEAVLYAEIV